VYSDNARIYRSQQFEFICASLGSTLIHSTPFEANGRGKIERFFRTVRLRFLSGVNVEGINSLDALNAAYFKWLEDDYTKKAHKGLNGLTPHDVLMSQVENLTLPTDLRLVDEIFLHRVSRKVQHDATIQIENTLYETEPAFANRRLEVRYAPEWLGDEAKKLPLYLDGKKIGETWMVRFYDNARAKRKFPGNRKPKADAAGNAGSVISYSDMMGGDNNV